MKLTPAMKDALGAAGIRIAAPAAPARRYVPGTLVAGFEVPSRPVPWKAPSTTRTGHSYKDSKLVAWQAEVALHARLAMAGRPPYAGPVRLALEFHLSRRPGTPPDLSNLVKASEDALQGVVILNDRQVVAIGSARSLDGTDRACIRVYAEEAS